MDSEVPIHGLLGQTEFARRGGCGAVVLERLHDAGAAGGRICSRIHGSAVNQSRASGGLTIPSAPGEQRGINKAPGGADVAPAEVDCLEAHVDGFDPGDPIDVLATAARGALAACSPAPMPERGRRGFDLPDLIRGPAVTVASDGTLGLQSGQACRHPYVAGMHPQAASFRSDLSARPGFLGRVPHGLSCSAVPRFGPRLTNRSGLWVARLSGTA